MTDEAVIPPDGLPSEDPGADTQRRFRYQAAYAALRLLELLRDETGLEELICEQFEDILLKHGERNFTGIQVKTRATGRMPFKATDPAMIHSLARFIDHEQRCPNCFSGFVIATNCGFWNVDRTAGNLEYLLGLAAEATEPLSPHGHLTKFAKRLCPPARDCRVAKSDPPALETVLAVLRKTKLEVGASLEGIESELVKQIGTTLGAENHQLGSIERAANALIAATLRAAAQPGPPAASVYCNPAMADDPLQDKRFRRDRVQQILQDALGLHAPLAAFEQLQAKLDRQHGTTQKKLDGVLAKLDSSSRDSSPVHATGIRRLSILKTGQGPRLEMASPATLLSARYQVVPFFTVLRQRELEILDVWCGRGRESFSATDAATSSEPCPKKTPDPLASVRLLVGPGGTGKTRLMIHWSEELRGAQPAWNAGFLPEQVAAKDLDTLLAGDRPTLIVVDYAESRPGLLDLLRRLAARPAEGLPPCRVVLLSRDVGDWWLALRQPDAEIAALLDR